MSSIAAFIIAMCAVGAIVIIFIVDAWRGNLNIKSSTVGDGQYGNARWATQKEINETYQVIPFQPKKWRAGEDLPQLDGATVLGYLGRPGHVSAHIDTSDSHTMLISTTGGGKTTFFLYPNIEMTCACGFSFLATDTKGDVFRDYAGIAQRYYGYTPYVIDLRNPTTSHGFNMLHLVNKYIDQYKSTGSLSDKARAERYAKITAKTIVRVQGFDGGGQNSFFYDAAEGLIASTILLVSEFCGKGERHIVSVFKIVQELLQTKSESVPKGSKIKPKNEYQKLIDLLPPEHKAKWLAGAALNTGESSMHSVMSTAMSRLLSFIDSELEQILCFESGVDAEQFCNGKTAVFIVFPEEDATKHFLVSLFVSQLYNEALVVANQDGKNKLDKRVIFYLDEYGTLPKFDNAEDMFTAGRSRNIFLFPMLQSLAQLTKNYGKDGAEIITDCCQNSVFGGLAPLSKSADDLSRALGNQTVQSGSVSHSGGMDRTNSSRSLQMIQRPLLTADEIKTLEQNKWILMKSRSHPLITTMKRFNEWGIILDCPFTMPENAERTVKYASSNALMASVSSKYPPHQTITEFNVNDLEESTKPRKHSLPLQDDLI